MCDTFLLLCFLSATLFFKSKIASPKLEKLLFFFTSEYFFVLDIFKFYSLRTSVIASLYGNATSINIRLYFCKATSKLSILRSLRHNFRGKTFYFNCTATFTISILYYVRYAVVKTKYICIYIYISIYIFFFHPSTQGCLNKKD